VSAYNPYDLRPGDTGVQAQVGGCSYWPILDTFVVSVFGVDGTDAYTTAGAVVEVDGVTYVVGKILLAHSAHAFDQFSWVTFDVIGINQGWIVIDNLQPA
jgi:hypothetical protein